MGETETRSGEEEKGERRKRIAGPPVVFRKSIYRPAHQICNVPIQRQQDSGNDTILDGVLSKNLRHLLWECGAARDLWAKTGPLFFPCLPAGGAQIGYQLAILGVGRGLKDMTPREFTSLWLTLNVIKDAIWATRNLLVGKRVTVPLHACELMVTSMLQGYQTTIFGRGGRGRTEKVPAATDPGRP